MLQFAEGYTVTLPDEVHKTLDMRTDPTWPTTWFAPKLTGKGPSPTFTPSWPTGGANHGAFVYGHIGKDLITLASMLRNPVSMHNLDEKRDLPSSRLSLLRRRLPHGRRLQCRKTYGPLYK